MTDIPLGYSLCVAYFEARFIRPPAAERTAGPARVWPVPGGNPGPHAIVCPSASAALNAPPPSPAHTPPPPLSPPTGFYCESPRSHAPASAFIQFPVICTTYCKKRKVTRPTTEKKLPALPQK